MFAPTTGPNVLVTGVAKARLAIANIAALTKAARRKGFRILMATLAFKLRVDDA